MRKIDSAKKPIIRAPKTDPVIPKNVMPPEMPRFTTCFDKTNRGLDFE